jgi:hypothetical protein
MRAWFLGKAHSPDPKPGPARPGPARKSPSPQCTAQARARILQGQSGPNISAITSVRLLHVCNHLLFLGLFNFTKQETILITSSVFSIDTYFLFTKSDISDATKCQIELCCNLLYFKIPKIFDKKSNQCC